MQLRAEVDKFLQKRPNYKGKIFIIYGAGHKLWDVFSDYSFERAKMIHKDRVAIDFWTTPIRKMKQLINKQ